MRKTATMIFGAALAATPLTLAQTAPPAAQDSEQTRKQMVELQQTLQNKVMAATAGPNTFTFVTGQMFNGNPVKGQPYSAEAVTESTQTLTDGNKIVNRTSTMRFRDSDGRERREESIGKIGGWTSGGEPAKVVMISDPVARMSYTLHTENRTAEKMAAPAGGMVTMRTAGSGGGAATTSSNSIEYSYKVGAEIGAAEAAATLHAAHGDGPNVGIAIAGGRGGAGGMIAAAPLMRNGPGKVEDLGTQMIEGVPARGTRTTTTIPAGQIGNEREINIVSESWYSNELQMQVMSKHSDPRTGESVYKLTNINRSEPQRSLFEIPGDYTISEPTMPRAARKVIKDEQ